MSEEGLKTLKVSGSVWEILMRLKIEWRAKSIDEVLKRLLERAGELR